MGGSEYMAAFLLNSGKKVCCIAILILDNISQLHVESEYSRHHNIIIVAKETSFSLVDDNPMA